MTRRIDEERGARARARKTFRTATATTIVAVLHWTTAVCCGPLARAAETPSAQHTGEPTAMPRAGEGNGATISLDDYLAGVSKPGLTEEQRKKFAGRYEGGKVTWTGYLRAVSRNKSRDGDSFLLILKAKPVTDPPPGVFLAWFGVEHEKSLVSLAENQKVTVSGKLSLGRDPKVPELKDATLQE